MLKSVTKKYKKQHIYTENTQYTIIDVCAVAEAGSRCGEAVVRLRHFGVSGHLVTAFFTRQKENKSFRGFTFTSAVTIVARCGASRHRCSTGGPAAREPESQVILFTADGFL